MGLREIIIFHLIIYFFTVQVQCFSIAAPDKIALEQGMEVVSDRKVFLPLGWPAQMTCEAATKLREINVIGASKLEWKIRYLDSRHQEDLEDRNRTMFVHLQHYLQIGNATRDLDNAVLECFVFRPGHNTTLVSRLRLEIQDCVFRIPGDQTAYNLHNPCAFGKCQLSDQDVVECICFRQYTGKHCNKRKTSSWLQDLIPYVPSLSIICLFTLYQIGCGSRKERKREKMMAISGFAGFSDRADFEMSFLYPFIRKIRKCRYDSDEEVVESSEKKRKKAQRKENERLKNMLERADLATGGDTTAAFPTGVTVDSTTGAMPNGAKKKAALWTKVDKKRKRHKRKRASQMTASSADTTGSHAAESGAMMMTEGDHTRQSTGPSIGQSTGTTTTGFVPATEVDDGISERRKDQIQ